jgi:Xaa-Pro aminopeptidase
LFWFFEQFRLNTSDYLLQPNMVITVEPGLYLPASPHVPEHFHNIGIRIEDDVVIGSSGPAEVLTRSAPKSVDEIEAIMKQ